MRGHAGMIGFMPRQRQRQQPLEQTAGNATADLQRDVALEQTAGAVKDPADRGGADDQRQPQMPASPMPERRWLAER